MLSSPSETKYPTEGESQNADCLNTCLCVLFLSSVPSASIYCTEVYKSLYEVICQLLSLFPFYRPHVSSKVIAPFMKKLVVCCGKKNNKPTQHWGCGYRIFITFQGCIWGTDVNRQSARSCHLRHGTWALFGINSFKGKVILAANQIDSCYKMTF